VLRRRIIIRRAAWTTAYLTAVFAVVGALGYVEVCLERRAWTADLRARDWPTRAAALSRFGLSLHPWPSPLPCDALASSLGDVPEVRREAVPALVQVIRRGECVPEIVAQLHGDDPVTREGALRVLRAAPPETRAVACRVVGDSLQGVRDAAALACEGLGR
jgi:hypothetical protein